VVLLLSVLLSASVGIPLASTAVACAGATAGVLLTGARRYARAAIAFGGGVLVGVSLLSLLPELIGEIGWGAGALLFAGGYLLLGIVDRYFYPVCPSCSHNHDHAGCAAELHGFAVPLIAATAVHSFLDGWSIAAAQNAPDSGLHLTLPLAVLLHKIPEGVALGALLLAAQRSRTRAIAQAVAAESVTLLGALAAALMAPALGTAWLTYPLAIAGGCFLYLGFHAIHEEWKRRGLVPAVVPGLGGALCAALVQTAAHAMIH
jgi:zinc transporter ZupT